MPDDGLGDWRLLGVTTLAEDVPAAYPGGPSHEEGDRLVVSSLARTGDDRLLGFSAPSPIALALAIAIDSAEEAARLRDTLAFQEGPSPEGTAEVVAQENTPHLFDFFQEMMKVIVFSFHAVESYANSEISRAVEGKVRVEHRGEPKLMTAFEIQRWMGTEEKIGTVLPDLMDTANPKRKGVWNDFKDLKDARDSTVHLKGEDAYAGEISRSCLFTRFLEQDPAFFPQAAVSVIEFFEADDQPRWLESARRRTP